LRSSGNGLQCRNALKPLKTFTELALWAGLLPGHDSISEAHPPEAFKQMKPIDPVELCDAFEKAKPIVLKIARISSARGNESLGIETSAPAAGAKTIQDCK
jgi:hypothetical protein